MKIRSLKLRDRQFGDEWARSVENRWNYADFQNDPRWKQDWISFDGVVYHAASDRVLCGITSFSTANVFWAWDRRREQFVDLHFADVADRYDAKFHRAMELTRNGRYLYAATALLHDVDRFFDAPGGGLYRYDTSSGTITKLGIPLPHVYIQSIALDEQRGAIYSMHFTPERLSRFDIATGTSRDLGPIGSGLAMGQGENIVLDDSGAAWCGWNVTRAWQSEPGPDAFRLCKFDPRLERIVYFAYGPPRASREPGFAKVEGLFNLGTGCLFASGDNGSLYRIDTDSGKTEYLGSPIRDRRSRLTSLVINPRNGHAYGISGRDGQCQLLRFDPRRGTFELGCDIVDEQGVAMWQCHDITITPDGVLYAAENDNPHRSGYLWEISNAT